MRRSPNWVAAALALIFTGGLVLMVSAGESRVLGKGLRVGCQITGNGDSNLYVKPKICIVFNPTGTFAGSLDLHKLRWTKWTASGGVGTGVECGFRATCQNTQVRVTVSGLKHIHCIRNDYRSFFRIKATSASGSTSLRPIVCPSDESL